MCVRVSVRKFIENVCQRRRKGNMGGGAVGVTEIGTAGDAFELIAFYLWLCLKAKKTEN